MFHDKTIYIVQKRYNMSLPCIVCLTGISRNIYTARHRLPRYNTPYPSWQGFTNTSFSPMSRALSFIVELRDIGRPLVWSTAAFHSRFLFLLVILLRLGTSGKAVLNLSTAKHKQMVEIVLAHFQPTPTRWVLVRRWGGDGRPLHQSILRILTPFCNPGLPGSPPAPDLPTPSGRPEGSNGSRTVTNDEAWQWVICPQQKKTTVVPKQPR